MAFVPIDGIRYVWPTPIFSGVLPDHWAINPSLCSYILDKEQTHESIGKSIATGWHSPEDLTAESSSEMG